MKQAISRKTAKNIAILIGVNLAFITLTVGFAVLHHIDHQGWMLSAYVTFLTISMITAKPEQFDLRENSMDELLHNVAQAELVHRIIIVLSFIPLLLIIPYGVPMVFIVTSIAAALIDLQFVIIQRYNRPRVMKLLKMKTLDSPGRWD